jgi:hypothetical protein
MQDKCIFKILYIYIFKVIFLNRLNIAIIYIDIEILFFGEKCKNIIKYTILFKKKEWNNAHKNLFIIIMWMNEL